MQRGRKRIGKDSGRFAKPWGAQAFARIPNSGYPSLQKPHLLETREGLCLSSAFTDAPLDVPMGILLPHRFPKRPLRIEIVGRFSDVKRYSNLGVHWTTGTNIPHSRSWHLDVTTHKPLTTTVVYLYDRYLIKVVAGQVMAIRCYDEPYPADRILMSFTNLIVEKLIVRNVEVQDLPQEFLDPLALAEKYKFQDDDETFILPVKPPTDEAKP